MYQKRTGTEVWYWQDKEFTSDMIGDRVGFVYMITEKNTGKKYVGKKLFKSTNRLPPLKGKTRKRKVVKESDWKKYFGSSDLLKTLVEEHGQNAFHREILHLCDTKGVMSYLELREQIEREVLLRDDYMNGIIQCKIHKSHVRSLRPE